MLNFIGEINIIGIISAILILFILGGMWFTLIFGKQYRLALGKENIPQEKLKPIFLIGPLLCSSINVFTSHLLMHALKVATLQEAMTFGVVIGFGYLAATSVNTGINPNIPRPLLYGLISGSYFFLAGIITSLILFLI